MEGQDLKPFIKSKTVWLNVLTLVSVLVPLIQNHINSEQVLTVNAVLNILLRLLTDKKLSWK